MSKPDFMSDEHDKLLQSSFSGPLPFCRGVLPVTPNDLVLYYGEDENTRQMNLFYPSSESLQLLDKACDPATFGRNKEDVYDESYRKARKLNVGSFMIGLDVVRLGLIKVIRENLVLGEESAKPVRAELYNLNVYGEGSFFKAHIDTPRGTNMFGSLVVIFPTSFDGGELIMKKGGHEWSFDASKALAKCQDPHIAYVALYSDIEHEVSMVKSGHRISVTYNLYYEDHARARTIPVSLSPNALALKSTLEALLPDSSFLPEGGWLGFNLEHKYPVEMSPAGPHFDLNKISRCLKGIDAETVRIAKELSLHVSLRALVSADYDLIAFQGRIPDLTNVPPERIAKEEGALILEEDVPVYWVRELSKLNQCYPIDVRGKEPVVLYEYESFCLFIEVGKPGARTTLPTPAALFEITDLLEEDQKATGLKQNSIFTSVMYYVIPIAIASVSVALYVMKRRRVSGQLSVPTLPVRN